MRINKLINSKNLSCLLLINGLFVSASYAPMVQARNCAQAVHNKHCAASSGHSNHQSQGSTVIGAAGQSPNSAQTNTHLGTSQKTPPPVVQIKQLVPHKTVVNVPPKLGAQTPPLLSTGVNVPPKVGAQTPPLLNTGGNVPPKLGAQTPPLLNTGGNVPPKLGAQTPPLLNTGGNVPPKVGAQTPPQPPNQKPVLNVYFIPPVVLTGISKGPSQQITTLPPKSFTGTSPVQKIHPNPPQVFTGVSKGPSQPITTLPPKSFTGTSPVQQIYPNQPVVFTGTSKAPPQSFTTLPPKTFTGFSSVPQPVLIGQATTPPLLPTTNNVSPGKHPQTMPTPVILTHVASTNLHPDVLLQQQMLHGSASLNSLEPHIKNMPVDVYTDKSVSQMPYQSSQAVGDNNKGFLLTVVGAKEPTFIDDTPLVPVEKSEDITFYFGYANADIHKDQLTKIDEIISKHSKNGKRIVLMGETDGFGSADYNKHLALLRANNILDALRARNVSVDETEVRILVRCCRVGHPDKNMLASTREQRITWVHFQ